MKFFHLSDLHFGKQMYKVQMVEKDQPFWIEQLLNAVDTYQPDAIVIAGDVYDRKNPSPEAMKLFDHMLTELVKRDKYVLIIPGNHDNATRLAHVSELLTAHKVYIAGDPERELMCVPVPNGDSFVNFWLMPYIYPKLVSDPAVLDNEEIDTYDSAVRALLEVQNIDTDACNVLVAHQNVLSNGVSPIHSESESIIGGVGEIEVSAFEQFDYVALGHIHNEQEVGRETVRYAGCPIFYDFSEEDRWKGIVMVEVNSKDDISVHKLEIPMLHRVKKLPGNIEDIIREGLSIPDKSGWYYQAVVTDRHVPAGTMEQLRAVFGESLVNVKRDYDGLRGDNAMAAAMSTAGAAVQLSLDEQFAIFFREQNENVGLDDEQRHVVQMILGQQERNGERRFDELKAVPAGETQELLDYLLSTVEEEE